MKHTRLLFLFAVLLAPLTGNAESLIRQASELIKAGEPAQALELFGKAAESGDPAGEYGLGVLYFQGTGVAQDFARSSRHFRAAAEQGHVLAQYNLGNAYLHGHGLDKDMEQAEHWWRQASTAGYVRAQYNLGILLLENAQAVEPREEGIAWLRASAERGFPKAREKLESLKESLDLEQQDEGDIARTILRNEARLLTLPPDTYSIQLFSGRLSASAETFVDQNDLRDQALRFRFTVKGETWTGVLYGLYRNGTDAKQTIGELQAQLKDVGPWLRKLSEIQAQIREVWAQSMTQTPAAPATAPNPPSRQAD